MNSTNLEIEMNKVIKRVLFVYKHVCLSERYMCHAHIDTHLYSCLYIYARVYKVVKYIAASK